MGGNDDQVAFWNGAGGAAWRTNTALLDAELAGVGEAALAALAAGGGERVLDVGCGPGTSSIAIARAVGATGAVVGVDVSAVLLELARQRAAAAGTAHAIFREADAQTASFEGPPFDAVFSRFGVMFFADPIAAFANLRRATRPGGRLVFACWQDGALNPWFAIPAEVIAKVLGVDLVASGPGPFSLASPDTVRAVVGDGGWRTVELVPFAEEIGLPDAAAVEARIRYSLHQGPAARALAGLPDEQREAVAAGIRAALPVGSSLGRRAWIVSARA